MREIYIGIKDGKVWDKTTDLINKRSSDIPDEDYILVDNIDICIDDTWDFQNNINLKDSFRRFIEPEKTADQLKLEDFEIRIKALEDK